MKLISAILFLILITSCGHYMPPKIDAQTGLYQTHCQVFKKEIKVYKTDVDLKRYRYVFLETDSWISPGSFEFFTREALAKEGFLFVYSAKELASLVTSNDKFSGINSISDPVALYRLSELFGPVLRIQFSALFDGSRVHDKFFVTDLSRQEFLLQIVRSTAVMTNEELDVHYPVLNVFKLWVKDCLSQSTGEST